MWGFDKLFNDVFSGWSESGRRFPPVDIYETEKAFVVEMELSGYGEDDVAMHVDKHVLTVSSEGVGKEKDRDYIVREVATPSFKRSFALPEGVDEAVIEGRGASRSGSHSNIHRGGLPTAAYPIGYWRRRLSWREDSRRPFCPQLVFPAHQRS